MDLYEVIHHDAIFFMVPFDIFVFEEIDMNALYHQQLRTHQFRPCSSTAPRRVREGGPPTLSPIHRHLGRPLTCPLSTPEPKGLRVTTRSEETFTPGSRSVTEDYVRLTPPRFTFLKRIYSRV
jgi:hypothetical protein